MTESLLNRPFLRPFQAAATQEAQVGGAAGASAIPTVLRGGVPVKPPGHGHDLCGEVETEGECGRALPLCGSPQVHITFPDGKRRLASIRQPATLNELVSKRIPDTADLMFLLNGASAEPDEGIYFDDTLLPNLLTSLSSR